MGLDKKGEIVVKGGEKGIFKVKNLRKDIKRNSELLKTFESDFSFALGPKAEQIIAEDRKTIQEQRQRLEEAEKQQPEAETISAEREKELQEMQHLR